MCIFCLVSCAAAGFVGRYVVNELARNGTQVVCPYRSLEEKGITLKQMGDLGQVGLGSSSRGLGFKMVPQVLCCKCFQGSGLR